MPAQLDILASDLAEADVLLKDVKSDRLRAVLERERAVITREITAVKEREAAAKRQAEAAAEAAARGPKAPVKEFRSYSWEQTTKALKIRATYPEGYTPVEGKAVWHGDDDNVDVHFDCDGKVLRLTVENLEKPIKPAEVTYKYKPTYVLVTLPKQTEGTWINLKEKDLGQKKLAGNSDDPTKDLMAMMKNMYNDGDDEMKAAIGKAMSESRGKMFS